MVVLKDVILANINLYREVERLCPDGVNVDLVYQSVCEKIRNETLVNQIENLVCALKNQTTFIPYRGPEQ